MSIAAAHAAAFYREVARHRRVWTIRDEAGFPAPRTDKGRRAMPFWSSLNRARNVIETVPAYSGFEPVEISWEEFRATWAPGLEADGLLMGVNWSGARATGYDMEAARVVQCVEAVAAAKNA